MGKRGGKRGGGRGGRGRSNARWDREEVVKSHGPFEGYYNGLELFDEEEKERFWAALRRELPSSFRFTGSKGHALSVQALLKERYVPEITSINFEDQPVDPPAQLSWFPDHLAWQMTTPKNVVRRFPPFSSFQKFLVVETAVGNISRQEVVSMVPPLLMDVRPGMAVLDMCASPGSKSAQLIEMVHGGEEGRIRKVLRDIRRKEGREMSPDGEAIEQDLQSEDPNGDWSDDGRSTGLLIANDVDSRRAHMLVHQMKRLNSPNLIVTNHDAAFFPSIKLQSLPASDGHRQQGRYLKFDRILADVPCSGDGTARKNANVWKEWTASNALGLHTIQERILVRAIQMLKIGGRVIYSTCSMNPVENEAVVAAAIDRCGGSGKVRILDNTNALAGLRRAPGLKSWKVADRNGDLWSSWEDVVAAQDEEADSQRAKIMPTMFPPDPTNDVPLEHCMRIYPHYQDTGAFFIAVLEKCSDVKARPEQPQAQPPPSVSKTPVMDIVSELRNKTADDPPSDHIQAADKLLPQSNAPIEAGDPTAAQIQNESTDFVPGEMSPRKRKLMEEAEPSPPPKRPAVEEGGSRNSPKGQALTAPNKRTTKSQQVEEPFKYMDPENEVLQEISSFYDLDSRFPHDRFMVRNSSGTPTKKIYYTSALVKEILTENEAKGMKFIHAGICMFVRQDVQSPEVCRWRIQTNGMPLVEAWLGDRRVVRLTSREVFRKLLIEMFPKLADEAWRDLGEIGQQTIGIPMGCCVLRVESTPGEDGFRERMVFPLWRSRHALNLMLPKEDRKAMLLRLYNEDTPLMDHSKDRFIKDNSKPNGADAMDITANTTITDQPEPDDRGTTSEEDGA